MVFQYPVMYPTLSVAENIEEPLRHDRRVSTSERAKRVDEMLDVLDMRPLRHAMIGELNTGLRQKVAVGRAVARQAEVVLFDEPTTNIEVDAKLQLIRAIKAVTERLRQTIVYVTHDQTEAMTLADSIALMEKGRIVQQDAPRALYAAPRTRFAGWFLGNPGMNYLAAEVRDGAVHADALTAPVPLPAGLAAVRSRWAYDPNGCPSGLATSRASSPTA
jgi:ABC-type sugar transport system ATPase subunit